MPLHNIARRSTIETAIERTQMRIDRARHYVVPVVLTRQEIVEHATHWMPDPDPPETHTMNRRTRTNIADYGLFAALLVTVPIAWASVAAFILLIDWVAG